MKCSRDHDEIRHPEDILLRASRPQRNSTWLPQHRDWRYATGVYQHKDFSDTPKQRTVWDELDYDAQIGVFGRERRRVVNGAVTQDGRRSAVRTASTGADIVGLDGTMEVETSDNAITPTASGQMSDARRGSVNKGKGKPAQSRSRARAHVKSRLGDEGAEDGRNRLEQTRFLVRLKFTENGIADLQRILNEPSTTTCPPPMLPSRQRTPTERKSPDTPGTARTATSSYTLESIESTNTFPLFERQWKDETQNFNMKKAVSSLRLADKIADPVPASYNWFPEAVPVDAIFPPGVPMSAKEINAYYPHHARWKDVMIRLINNDYRGADITPMQAWFRGLDRPPITAPQMNSILRDSLRRVIPDFKTAEGLYKGKPDRNHYTDHLKPGKYLEDTRFGSVVPTFDDLLKGLKYLPTGLDARGLTQCLVWYLNHRDMFSPRLEFNVLHTQSLIRALRQPLKAYGPQNLDKYGLREWKEKGCFVERRVEDEERRHDSSMSSYPTKFRNTGLEVDLNSESIKPHVVVPLRHILTFPMIAMIAMAAKGLEVGVTKAEERRMARVAEFGEDPVSEPGAGTSLEPTAEAAVGVSEEELQLLRIAKRALAVEKEQSAEPSPKKQATIPTGSRLLTAPRMPSAMRPPIAATATFSNGSAPWNATARPYSSAPAHPAAARHRQELPNGGGGSSSHGNSHQYRSIEGFPYSYCGRQNYR